MMLTFQNMRGNASPRGKGTDVPANARWGNDPRNSNSTSSEREGFPLFPSRALSPPVAWSRGEETTKQYHTFSSAAIDSHPAIHNPLLPFGKFAQTVIDGLAVFACLVLICATGVGLAVSVFFLLFCRF